MSHLAQAGDASQTPPAEAQDSVVQHRTTNTYSAVFVISCPPRCPGSAIIPRYLYGEHGLPRFDLNSLTSPIIALCCQWTVIEEGGVRLRTGRTVRSILFCKPSCLEPCYWGPDKGGCNPKEPERICNTP